MAPKHVVVIGAGLAGLSCALRLQERGIKCQLLEKSECVGGRVRTYVVDGFRLDRGFQVLLTAYPRTQQMVDYSALELKAFHPGAQVWYKGRFHVVSDPTRRPTDAIPSLLSPVGTLADKIRVLPLREAVTSGNLGQLMTRPEVTTEQRLHEFGFTSNMVERFFRPFLGGIFLEPDLVTSSRKFEFVMRMFSQGEAALPRLGMQAIPQQLANRLRPGVLRTGCAVDAISDGDVTLAGGEHIEAECVVLATQELEAARLRRMEKSVHSAAVTCLYFAAQKPAFRGPWLFLNGEHTGVINNLCFPSELHAAYAPPGQALVSATVLGVFEDEQALQRQVTAQLSEWFGAQTAEWRHLQTYSIPEALTLQQPPALEVVRKPTRVSERRFVCGDYLSITSIEGAISSGVRCADEIAQHWRQ